MWLKNTKMVQVVLIVGACFGVVGLAAAGESTVDYNNDGIVDDADYEILRSAFGSVEGDLNFLPAGDHDGDGVIAGADLGIHRQQVELNGVD